MAETKEPAVCNSCKGDEPCGTVQVKMCCGGIHDQVQCHECGREFQVKCTFHPDFVGE